MKKINILSFVAIFLVISFISNTSKGQGWSSVSGGVNNVANSLGVFNNELYVGGGFTVAGTTLPVSRIAKWNGTNWSAVGSGVSSFGSVYSFKVFNNELYVGGLFSNAGGLPANNVAKWSGTTWSAVGAGLPAQVEDLEVYNSELYASGHFLLTTGTAIAKWDGTNWIELGFFNCNNCGQVTVIYSMIVYNGELYAAGNFNQAPGFNGNGMARWNGVSWAPVGTGMAASNMVVLDMIEYAGELYAGGRFDSAGGVAANNIAKWNGSNWSAVGTGVKDQSSSPYVWALEVFGGELYVGGDFDTAGGNPAKNVAKWNGTSWSSFGSGLNWYANALKGYNGELYAGGLFNTAGGVPAPHVAKFTPCAVAPAQPGVISGSANLCPGAIDTYTIAPVPGAFSYSWSLPAGWSGTSTSNSIIVTAGTIGGSIAVSSVNTCGMSPAETLAVMVVPPLPVNISQSGNLLTATPSYASYQWYHFSTMLSGATNQTYIALLPGQYSVKVTDSAGCHGQSGVQNVTLGIDEKKNSGVHLSPNPNKGFFNVSGTSPFGGGDLILEARDVTGRLVYSSKTMTQDKKINIAINLSALSSGTYSLKIAGDKGDYIVLPFIKE